MTNGDRIRQMSNEDLAKFLQSVEDGEGNMTCEGCIYAGTHHANPDDEQYECGGCYWEDIGWYIKDWLNKEEKV